MSQDKRCLVFLLIWWTYFERIKIILVYFYFEGTNIHGALRTAVLAATASFTNFSSNGTTAKPEPIIIFLTDGDPTIGITEPDKILNMVKVKRDICWVLSLITVLRALVLY